MEIGSVLVLYLYMVLLLWSSGYVISSSTYREIEPGSPVVDSDNQGPSLPASPASLFPVDPDISESPNEKPDFSPLLVESANQEPSELVATDSLFQVHPGVVSILKEGLNGANVFNADPVFNGDKSLTRLDFANDFNTDKVITGSDSNAFGRTIPKPATVTKSTPFDKTHSSLFSESNPSGGNALKEKSLNGVRYAPLTKRKFIGTKYVPLAKRVPVDSKIVGLDRRYDHYLGLNVASQEKSDHFEPDDEITVYSHYRRAPSSLSLDRVNAAPIVRRDNSHLKKRDLFSVLPHDIDKREKMPGNQRRRSYSTRGSAILFKRSADKFGQSDSDNPMLRSSRLALIGRIGDIESVKGRVPFVSRRDEGPKNDGGRVHSWGNGSRVTQDGTLKFRADGPSSNFITDVGAVVTDRTTDDGEKVEFTQTDNLLNIRAYGEESVGWDNNEDDWENELEAIESDDLEETEQREDDEHELERRTGGGQKKKKNKKKKMPKKKKKKGGKSKG